MVLHSGASTTYGGQESRFGFVADFSAENEVGIDENISVGYKGKFMCTPDLEFTITGDTTHS